MNEETLNSVLKYNRVAGEEIERQQREIERLENEVAQKDNIINELEKRLISDKKFFEIMYKKSQLSEEEFKKQCPYTIGSYEHCIEILNKLQELKGSDKE